MDWNRAWRDALESMTPFGASGMESFTRTTRTVRMKNGLAETVETQSWASAAVSLGEPTLTPGSSVRLRWPPIEKERIGHLAERGMIPRRLLASRVDERLLIDQASIGQRRALHGPVPMTQIHLVRLDLGPATDAHPLYLDLRNASAVTLECTVLLEGDVPR